jgi:hypothetical protein
VPPSPARHLLAALRQPVAGSELDKAQRIKRCQDFMRLPWGPLQDCRKAIVASAVGTVLTTGAFQWWKRGFSSHITRITEGDLAAKPTPVASTS